MALPEGVFRYLKERYGLQHECFASPFNAYSLIGSYGSRFRDTDASFHSKGSFFDFYPEEGVFECNPPFVEEIMIHNIKHIQELLEKAEENHKAMTFFLIVPAWRDENCESYNRARYGTEKVPEDRKDNRFFKKELLLSKCKHFYRNGMTYKDDYKVMNTKSDSLMFVLQTSSAKPLEDNFEEKIMARWNTNSKEYRENKKHSKGTGGYNNMKNNSATTEDNKSSTITRGRNNDNSLNTLEDSNPLKRMEYDRSSTNPLKTWEDNNGKKHEKPNEEMVQSDNHDYNHNRKSNYQNDDSDDRSHRSRRRHRSHDHRGHYYHDHHHSDSDRYHDRHRSYSQRYDRDRNQINSEFRNSDKESLKKDDNNKYSSIIEDNKQPEISLPNNNQSQNDSIPNNTQPSSNPSYNSNSRESESKDDSRNKGLIKNETGNIESRKRGFEDNHPINNDNVSKRLEISPPKYNQSQSDSIPSNTQPIENKEKETNTEHANTESESVQPNSQEKQ